MIDAVGPLFTGLIRLAPRCTAYGADSAQPGSAEDPFAFIVLIVGFIVVGAALIVEIRYAWPVWPHMTVSLPLALALCIEMLAGVQYRRRRHEVVGNG